MSCPRRSRKPSFGLSTHCFHLSFSSRFEVVALHADEATDAAFAWARKRGLDLAVVPCCVFAELFPVCVVFLLQVCCLLIYSSARRARENVRGAARLFAARTRLQQRLSSYSGPQHCALSQATKTASCTIITHCIKQVTKQISFPSLFIFHCSLFAAAAAAGAGVNRECKLAHT
jgi:hypothetical protein